MSSSICFPLKIRWQKWNNIINHLYKQPQNGAKLCKQNTEISTDITKSIPHITRCMSMCDVCIQFLTQMTKPLKNAKHHKGLYAKSIIIFFLSILSNVNQMFNPSVQTFLSKSKFLAIKFILFLLFLISCWHGFYIFFKGA